MSSRRRPEVWDRRLGVRTAGWQPAIGTYDDPAWRVEYKPAAYSVLARLFRRVGLGPTDVFGDLGTAARSSSPAGSASAARSGSRSTPSWSRAPTTISSAAACRAPASSSSPRRPSPTRSTSAACFFMFNPFDRGTMAKVVEGLTASLARRPRPLRVAYLNPLSDATLDASPALVRLDHWDDGPKSEGVVARFRRAGGWSATFFAARSGAEM